MSKKNTGVVILLHGYYVYILYIDENMGFDCFTTQTREKKVFIPIDPIFFYVFTEIKNILLCPYTLYFGPLSFFFFFYKNYALTEN